MDDLIRKYNVTGRRYTSYPTAVQFREGGERAYAELACSLEDRNRRSRPLSLYVHVPFCFSLCWYCACTKIITRDRGRGDHYMDYLEKEMDLLSGRLNPGAPLQQLHFGGGTPTFLEPAQLLRLGDALRERFQFTGQTEFSVEIDPRRCTRAHVQALAAIGCNRASLGVQDTNPEVQKAIHRVQPTEQVERVCRWLREEGIRSINFDLIYGLPRQSRQTFGKTLEEVTDLGPDRLAVYSYAHLPSRVPAQRLLEREDLPSADEKIAMLRLAIDHLDREGYRFIGMDHFAREGDELVEAMASGDLHRNFQGYSTRSGADLYALGMSGISGAGGWYWQNAKELGDYYRELDREGCPSPNTPAWTAMTKYAAWSSAASCAAWVLTLPKSSGAGVST
ncbi:MAG: oxygen-independent coproporphyrinogen III oxidase [Balneolaceae bacterium]|nr:oxygen-independent coproporphyrinogen III oxidase [Balneolaceae bacterium]